MSFDEKKQSQEQDNAQRDVTKTFRKIELTEEQRSKLNEGKTIYIDDLVDKNGKPYSGYITWNKEAGKLDFMFAKEYKEKLAAGKIIPDDAKQSAQGIENRKQAENQSQDQDENKPKNRKGRKI